MNYTSRIYDLSKLEDLKAMEKEQQRLYNKYPVVKVVQVGLDKFRIICSML
jgi:hypothetical protein